MSNIMKSRAPYMKPALIKHQNLWRQRGINAAKVLPSPDGCGRPPILNSVNSGGRGSPGMIFYYCM